RCASTRSAHRKGNHIHIDHVWRQGKRVF
ncbi:hypothetical protein MLO22_21275, partial [Escherichia coli]|nr:hypothetical protein [Escherichia coli]